MYREHASDLQKNISEVQSARYEHALLRLMERSADDTNLVNAMNELTQALDWVAAFGNPEEAIPQERVEWYANAIRQVAETIRSSYTGYTK